MQEAVRGAGLVGGVLQVLRLPSERLVTSLRLVLKSLRYKVVWRGAQDADLLEL